MDRAMILWTRLGDHPQGRWLRLILEICWILGWVLAIWACWDAPQTWFSYLSV